MSDDLRPEKWLPTSEAASHVRLQPQTLRRWRQRGGGPPYLRLGDGPSARCVYALSALEAWIAAHTVTTRPRRSLEAPAVRSGREQRPGQHKAGAATPAIPRTWLPPPYAAAVSLASSDPRRVGRPGAGRGRAARDRRVPVGAVLSAAPSKVAPALAEQLPHFERVAGDLGRVLNVLARAGADEEYDRLVKILLETWDPPEQPPTEPAPRWLQ